MSPAPNKSSLLAKICLQVWVLGCLLGFFPGGIWEGRSHLAEAQVSPRSPGDIVREQLAERKRIDALLSEAKRVIKFDAAEARRKIEAAIQLKETRAETYFRAAEIYAKLKDHPKIIHPEHRVKTLLLQALVFESDPWQQAIAHEQIAEIVLYARRTNLSESVRDGWLVEAERHLLSAHQRRYENEDPVGMGRLEHQLARVAVMRRDHRDALRWIQDAKAHGRPESDLYRLETGALLALGRPREALGVIRKNPSLRLLKLDNIIQPEILFGVVQDLNIRSMCYEKMGKSELALLSLEPLQEWLKKQLLEEPAHTPIWEYLLSNVHERLAAIHFARGDFAQAAKHYQSILDLQTGHRAQSMNNLAWALAMHSPVSSAAFKEARGLAEEAVEANPSGANLDTLGEIYLRAWMLPEALRAIDRARAWNPDALYLEEQRARIWELQDPLRQTRRGPMLRFRPWAPPSEETGL